MARPLEEKYKAICKARKFRIQSLNSIYECEDFAGWYALKILEGRNINQSEEQAYIDWLRQNVRSTILEKKNDNAPHRRRWTERSYKHVSYEELQAMDLFFTSETPEKKYLAHETRALIRSMIDSCTSKVLKAYYKYGSILKAARSLKMKENAFHHYLVKDRETFKKRFRKELKLLCEK